MIVAVRWYVSRTTSREPDILRQVVPILALILVGRLVLHVALYAAGFASLTADEFARVVQAARWAEHPFWSTHGEWLPLHAYVYGAWLACWWNLLWAPRVLTIVFGLAGIVAVGVLTRAALGSWWYGLAASVLLAVNPGHLWLSATPLTEAAYTACVAASLAALVGHLRSGGAAAVLASAGFLGLACGLRYEGWMLAIPYSVVLLVRAASLRHRPNACLAVVIGAIVPWAVPVLWMWGSWNATGDGLAFMHAIRQYKLTWYGGDRSYAEYLQTWLRLDPWATVAAPIGCAIALARVRRDAPLAVLAFLSLTSTLVFIALHQGQVESKNNLVRYVGPFIFLAYPLVLVAVDACGRRLGLGAARARGAGVALALVVVAAQIRGAFSFIPDGNAEGLAVGSAIRELRRADTGPSAHAAMIELEYWSYLAVHVGADDVDRIFYDRAIDLARRSTASVIAVNRPGFRSCLAQWDVGWVAVRSPDLRNLLHQDPGVARAVSVDDWEIFRVVPSTVRPDPGIACPLVPGG